MFDQIFFSPQVKRSAVIITEHDITNNCITNNY